MAGGRSRASSGSALRLTIFLLLVILLVGLAGAEAFSLLQYAMRLPTADDIAQIVCTSYQTRNYDLLIKQIEPETAHPPTTDLSNSALKQQLQALDSASGNVTACSYSSEQISTGEVQYIFRVKRARVPQPGSLLLLLMHEPDGSWKISRGSISSSLS